MNYFPFPVQSLFCSVIHKSLLPTLPAIHGCLVVIPCIASGARDRRVTIMQHLKCPAGSIGEFSGWATGCAAYWEGIACYPGASVKCGSRIYQYAAILSDLPYRSGMIHRDQAGSHPRNFPSLYTRIRHLTRHQELNVFSAAGPANDMVFG
jgi:hypothetical protein